MQGVVKFFNVKKGFGFIAGENGEDYYLYHKHVNRNEPGFIVLRKDDKVTFDPSPDKPADGQCVTALNVSLVKS